MPEECCPGYEKAMADLLKNIGDRGVCRGCAASIFWVTHRNGKKTPYDPSGLNHFISCVKAKDFKAP
jgi:hypothetical protein